MNIFAHFSNDNHLSYCHIFEYKISSIHNFEYEFELKKNLLDKSLKSFFLNIIEISERKILKLIITRIMMIDSDSPKSSINWLVFSLDD